MEKSNHLLDSSCGIKGKRVNHCFKSIIQSKSFISFSNRPKMDVIIGDKEMLTQISTQTHHIYLFCNQTTSPMQIRLNRWWVCCTHTNKFGYLSRCVHKHNCAHMSKLETVSRRAAVIKGDQNVDKLSQEVATKQMHMKKNPSQLVQEGSE